MFQLRTQGINRAVLLSRLKLTASDALCVFEHFIYFIDPHTFCSAVQHVIRNLDLVFTNQTPQSGARHP